MPATSSAPKPSRLPRLGTNLRRFRLEANLTQLELAHAMGYRGRDAGAYISRVEANKQEPRLEVLQKLARILGRTLDELILGKS